MDNWWDLLLSSEVIEGVQATRMELLALKIRRNLAQKGHDLLREKMDALIMHFFEILEDFDKVRKSVQEGLQEAFLALTEAKMVLGPMKIREIALSAPHIAEVSVQTKSIMGVRVPLLRFLSGEKEEEKLFYSFVDTSVKLDEAIERFRKAMDQIVKLAEVQGALIRLAREISETRRRVNALNYIMIPRLVATIDYIQLQLSEQERQSFTRLKKIKAKLEKKGKKLGEEEIELTPEISMVTELVPKKEKE